VIDHLVYATPDLEATVAALAARLGVEATPGGRHPTLGTRNALLGLGAGAYLEVISADGEPPGPAGGPRPFGLDGIAAHRLATWAARTADIDAAVARARAAGYDPGPVQPLSRRLPAGDELRWRLTPPGVDAVELVPFLIEWAQDAPHPSATAPDGCRLVAFAAEHPDPDGVTAALRALGVEIVVAPAPSAALVAVIEGPAGSVVLR
jgi:hypothetical protein